MTNLKKISLAVLALTLSHSALADTASKSCKVYNWKPGDVITIEASLNKQTHITLPEVALDVLWGPKDLWAVDNVENNVFVTPTNPNPAGKDTTLTVMGNSRNSYEFELVRVDKLSVHCIVISTSGALIKRSAWESKDQQSEATIKILQQQLAKANADKVQAAEDAKRQATEAIKSYRSSITSKYDWTNGTGWFADKQSIESVYDDGRFTYIRLNSDERGVMSIQAEIDGKTEILEKVYDATKREYRIAGIYPKFVMRAGNSELVVVRKG